MFRFPSTSKQSSSPLRIWWMVKLGFSRRRSGMVYVRCSENRAFKDERLPFDPDFCPERLFSRLAIRRFLPKLILNEAGHHGEGARAELGPGSIVVPVNFPQLCRRPHWNPYRFTKQRIQTFQPQNLSVKDHAEVAGNRTGHILQGNLFPEFFLYRGHRLRFDPARDDKIEVAEVSVHVESETVRGNATGNMNADGGDFSCLLFCVGTGLCPVRAGRRPAPTRSIGPYSSKTRNPVS